VVLGHIHDSEVDAILKEVPEVTIVIAGHSHVVYEHLHKFDGRIGALVTGYGVMLGRLDLQVDIKTHTLKSAEWKQIRSIRRRSLRIRKWRS